MDWFKLHVGFHRNPKARLVGPIGRDLFLLICSLNAEYEFDGHIPAQYSNPEYLAFLLVDDTVTIRNTLALLAQTGMIEQPNDGSIVLPDYASSQWRCPVSNKMRQRKYRELQKKTDDVTKRNAGVTKRNAGVTESNAREEKRREEKRSKNIVQSDTTGPFDLDSLYEKYPRKEGKSRGMAKLKATIKTPEAYEKMQQAIRRYVTATVSTEKNLIMLFSTWCAGRWEDWVEGNPREGPSSTASGSGYTTEQLERFGL